MDPTDVVPLHLGGNQIAAVAASSRVTYGQAPPSQLRFGMKPLGRHLVWP